MAKPMRDRKAYWTNKAYIDSVKLSEGCRFCPNPYQWPTVSLGFHHVYPEEKRYEISRMHARVGIERIRDELNKCIVVCHNHHSMLEAGLLEFDKERWKRGLT